MNYIKQINGFWEKAEEHSFGAGEIAMYMYLLHSSNVQAWKNPVIKPNAILQNAVGVQSFNTLTKIRNRLQQTGFIRFKTKNGSQAVEYDLFDVEKQTFSKFEKVVDEVTEKVPDKVAAKVRDKVPENTNVLYKHKPKQKLKDDDNHQHSHEVFAEKLFTETGALDKQNIELQLNPRRLLTKADCEEFNRHLFTEKKHHVHWSEYLKHLRNWLNTRPDKNKQQSYDRKENQPNAKLGRIDKSTISNVLNRRQNNSPAREDSTCEDTDYTEVNPG